jgi:hypothetical protein
MPHPLLPLWLAGGWIVKHVAVYQFARSYGFSRLYKRLMEVNRSLSGSVRSSQYQTVRGVIEAAFRSPTKAAQLIEDNVGVLKVLSEFEKKYLLNEKRGVAESVVYTAMKATPLYKAVQQYGEFVNQGKSKKGSDKS